VDSHKELREPPQIRSSWTHKRESKIHHKELMRCTELNENKCPEGTWRERPPFPVNSRTETQQSMAKNPNSKEERRGTGRREEGARQEEAACCPGHRERERRGRGVRGFLTPTTLNPKD
jgi:hypothetical protein